MELSAVASRASTGPIAVEGGGNGVSERGGKEALREEGGVSEV